jgi:hypothetical protein
MMMMGAALLLAIPTARADFEINIFSGSTLIFQSIDNVAEDDNPVATQIGLSSAALADLNAALSGAGLTLQFSSLAATTNQGSADPFSNLTVNGEVRGAGSVTIDVSSTDYNTPVGDNKIVNSSASATFTNAGLGTTSGFTSYYNGDNSQLGRVTATGFLSFASAPVTPISNTSSGQGTAPPLFVSGPNPYALENVTTLNVLGDSSTKVSFTGTTTVLPRAVPEPTSIALVLLGSSFMAVRMRRRRLA